MRVIACKHPTGQTKGPLADGTEQQSSGLMTHNPQHMVGRRPPMPTTGGSRAPEVEAGRIGGVTR